MSTYLSKKYAGLTPYTPGEQPKERKYTKLNTNESPFPPAENAIKRAYEAAQSLQLYSDPECRRLTQMIADLYSVDYEEVICTNGSDEILNFAFMAFCDSDHPAVFPDITYGFYSVFAELNGVPYEKIPLCEDFSVNVEDYIGVGKTVFIANPNAPTGICLPVCEIERIVSSNPNTVVVVDEAYVDFGGESAIPLIKKYKNLLVTQTFSKSRSMAGARLGFGVGCRELIADINMIKYSTNPYNINSMTMAAGIGVLESEDYTRANCAEIIKNREHASKKLAELGFSMTASMANFIFAKHESVDGGEIYRALRERGVLVRHFDSPRISQYNRITVGSREQMDTLLEALADILEEKK